MIDEMFVSVMGEYVFLKIGVYHESRKWDLKIRLMNEGRCDERLKAWVEESTCLTDGYPTDTQAGTQSRSPKEWFS
jgi:hypothetical protein